MTLSSSILYLVVTNAVDRDSTAAMRMARAERRMERSKGPKLGREQPSFVSLFRSSVSFPSCGYGYKANGGRHAMTKDSSSPPLLPLPRVLGT
jgi:hypothetical protein